jgi:Xaa-Pro aminopeptidase
VAVAAQPVRALDESKLDLTATQKVAKLAPELERLQLDALLVQTLDELAYLSNLRGSDIPFNSTFRGVGLLTPKRLTLGCKVSEVPAHVRQARLGAVEFVEEDGAWAQVKKGMRVGFDPRTVSARSRDRIVQAGAEAVSVESPVGPMKAKKGPRELKAMVAAFAKADKVVSTAADWLCTEVAKRNKVSEADFAEKVEALFTASGATGLSFKVISAAGRNGATIHYSHPNPRRLIKQGELMLLDTGAYYAEGYATDLTRTFLVGPKSQKASKEQKYYFTLVLKSAIAGMRARIPFGTRGDQLDAITRAPLWYEGLNYNHGTGHGVGINVHEFPPRIAPQGTGILEEGMVFSIEPGVYLEKFGGVRIENLCTLERIKGMAGTLQVRPLTFSPLDQRLIDRKLLNEEERTWLAQYMRGKAPQ